MAGRLIAGVTICCVTMSATLVFLSVLTADEPQADEGALAEAARSALDATVAEYDAGIANGTAENVYLWSKRLMEAQLQGVGKETAIADHLGRMRRLQEDVAARHKGGRIGGNDSTYHATAYYLAEAHLLQKRGTPPSK